MMRDEATTGEADAYLAGFMAARENAARELDERAYELARIAADPNYTDKQRNRATHDGQVLALASAAVRLMRLPVRLSDPA